MKKSSCGALVLLFTLTGCTKGIELKMAVQVVSEPEKADVKYKGKSLGQTPQDVSIETFNDLESIVAAKPEMGLVEKRVRIISPEKATLIFRLGMGEVSPVAKALGLTNVLIFDYSEKVAFDVDKYELKSEALPVLNKQAEILNLYFPKAVVNICGYTDSTGSEDHNLKLSLKRAQAVTDYLIARGVGRDRLKVHGFGKDYPVDANTSASGRALNRRTEVILPQ